MEVKLLLDQTAEGKEERTESNIYCIVFSREEKYRSNRDIKEQFAPFCVINQSIQPVHAAAVPLLSFVSARL